jgi:hypothetical protein
MLAVVLNRGINVESEAEREAAVLQAPLTHLEQGLGCKKCLMAIAFCVEMDAGEVVLVLFQFVQGGRVSE